MRLSTFIVVNVDAIIDEWETFGRSNFPPLHKTEGSELGKHCREILLAIARDMDFKVGSDPGAVRSMRWSETPGATADPAASHGVLRQRSGIGTGQLVSEFGALRANVLARWVFSGAAASERSVLEENIRFNEAVDAVLVASAESFLASLATSRDMFLAILGQDLRSPLSTIQMSNTVLGRSDFAGATRHNAAKRVKRALIQMNGLISDLLEYTRSRMGSGIPVERAVCDLAFVCEEAIESIRISHPERTFELRSFGDLTAAADASRMQQVLSNLLHNAVQHGDRIAPVKLIAEGGATDVVLRVWNAGQAIPEDSRRAIFEPWIQVPSSKPNSSDQSKTSLGLGLFIVKEIVTGHGGTIDVESSGPAGTEFKVRLPRASNHLRPDVDDR